MGHFAATIDQDSDLTADLETDLRKFASEFVADDVLDRNAAPGESFQPAYLAGLQTAGVAIDVDEVTSLNALPGSI